MIPDEAVEAAAIEYNDANFVSPWTAQPEWVKESHRDTVRKRLEKDGTL